MDPSPSRLLPPSLKCRIDTAQYSFQRNPAIFPRLNQGPVERRKQKQTRAAGVAEVVFNFGEVVEVVFGQMNSLGWNFHFEGPSLNDQLAHQFKDNSGHEPSRSSDDSFDLRLRAAGAPG